MRLIERPQITTLALPRSHTWPSELLPPHQAPFHFLPDVFPFAKFMLATPTCLLADLSRDLDELAIERKILTDIKDDLGIYFIDGAEERIRKQMVMAAALETPILRDQIERALKEQEDIDKRFSGRSSAVATTQLEQTEIPQELLTLKSGSATPVPPPVHEGSSKPKHTHNRNPPKQRRNVNPPPPSTSTYYYYQASSGLPLFLHPLDIRILLAHFHSYSSFPDTITIRVEAFAEGTVNDDLRKRCKYLSHLPEGADVVFIEADLEGVVGAEGLKTFEGPLKMRATRRKEKVRRDDRAKVRGEERERERERSHALWHSNRVHSDVTTSFRDVSLDDVEVSPNETVAAVPGTAATVTSGAWGSRSFASALHSSPTTPNRTPQQRSRRREEEDEWDIDAAWHDLERDAGARKKRGTRLVVLGGGMNGGRRR
jgi:hypothetical protein